MSAVITTATTTIIIITTTAATALAIDRLRSFSLAGETS